MSTKNDCSLKDTTILRKLILENPELPVLFFCGEEAWSGDYGYTQATATKGEIQNLVLYSDQWLDEEEYGEKIFDDLSDQEEYKTLNKEEFTKMIDKKVADAEFVKAIVVWIG